MPTAFVAFVVFFFWLAIQPIFSPMLEEWKRERCFGVRSLPIKTLLGDIDALSKRLGRVPKAEEELIELQGKPMPEISWEGETYRIGYRATDAKHFELHMGNVWVYDSRTPEEGWQSVFQW